MSEGAAVRRLLYVEDNDDNLYMLQLWFDVLGDYEILSARDGAAGMAMAAAEQPDLILMDLNLPEIDGWEATRRLKADPWPATVRRRSPPAATISTPSPSNSIVCSPRSSGPWPLKRASQAQNREPGG
jgi:CheY-like chemotaxis protein